MSDRTKKILKIAGVIVIAALCFYYYGTHIYKAPVSEEEYQEYQAEQQEERAQGEAEDEVQNWYDESVLCEDASDFVGQEGQFIGKVADISNENALYIDLGYAYPDENRLTLVVWPENQSDLSEKTDSIEVGDTVVVKGEVYTYGGVNNIKLTDSDQILTVFTE